MVPEAAAGHAGAGPDDDPVPPGSVRRQIKNEAPAHAPEGTPTRTAPPWGKPLKESDHATLAASWITREIADAAILRRVDTFEGRDVVGQKGNRDCAGMLIPYYWPSETSPHTYRLRRDRPEMRQGKDGRIKPAGKYLAPRGDGNRLYIPPGITLAQLQDIAIPIVIVEGEKKALALWRLANFEAGTPRFIPIAIGGVWNWRGKVGKATGPRGERIDVHGPIADLSRIECKGRTVLIVFDADVHTNESVQWAQKGIVRALATRAARVRLINLPRDSGANGVDELLFAWGPDRVLELFDQPEAEPLKEQELNQAQLLIALADEAKLFHTPEGEAYAQIPVDDHHETRTLRNKGFRGWLVRKFYQKCARPPGSQALQDAMGFLEAKAQFEGPEAPLFVRVAEHDCRIYIDLCDAKWRVVEIGPRGWRVMADPPIRFRRAKGMQSLPQPVGGGSITQLRSFLNVGGDNNWILCVCWLVAACRAKGPFPILILQGEQGSAKSTMVKFLRRIIDPSSALVRTPPRNARDLLIAASNSWVIAYDNLSAVPPWLSDSLCRLATGGGFSTRELYMDSEEVFFDAVRPVVLNGIDHLAERADLADRALTLNLPPIPNENRRDEAQLYLDFDRQLPQILGALFSSASVALARLPQTRLDRKPRMADFALWASAAEPALGFLPGAFMKAYAGNRAEAIHETLEADPVGAAILALMDRREGESWEGTCKQLLQHLEQHVDDGVRKLREWPKSPRGLSSRLRRLITFLRELRIQVTFHARGTNGQRTVTIIRTETHSTATSATTATPDPDGSSGETDTAEQPGGGRVSQVANQARRDDEPPLGSSPANSLSGSGSGQAVAEVAKVAVVCNGVPSDQEHTVAASDRINLCARCGPVSWEWRNGTWVCPICLEPARSQRQSRVRERIEL